MNDYTLDDLIRKHQLSFNPVDYGFEWTSNNWYSWDYTEGHKTARKDRDNLLKQARKAGLKVSAESRKALITRGGIGSGHPQIDELVTVYCINCF